MAEKTFNLKLTKKEVLILDHGRFKGMTDLLNSIEKRINSKMEKGEKIDQTVLIGELAAHKLQANKMLNKTSQLLSQFAENEEKKTETPTKPEIKAQSAEEKKLY